ncbi:hypothetical protein Vadar_007648 [Vaccinium darrowii]|uniref:Uncharacterized protein n=1 Tax=Vaccinium darrowii TaxID=229202 RepID=A0ACB7WYX5_9ERIC|nr:hypothetical protein Vadar_007648 [Vaccinium darrowii]
MASTSGQEFNSNKIYRRWLAETFDGHETAEDDLLDYPNENNNDIEPCISNLPTSLKPLEPYVGMEFESAEDAREFYEIKLPPQRSHRVAFHEDEKDLKIRELSTELHRERKRSSAYQEQLQMVLKYAEEHTRRLSLNVQEVFNEV